MYYITEQIRKTLGKEKSDKNVMNLIALVFTDVGCCIPFYVVLVLLVPIFDVAIPQVVGNYWSAIFLLHLNAWTNHFVYTNHCMEFEIGYSTFVLNSN